MSILYFAYGANLDRKAMLLRCPGATVVERATLADHQLVAMQEGWLSIAPRCETHTDGLLWKLNQDHLIALDEYEEVADGLYVHEHRLVQRQSGGCVEALVYVGSNPGPGRLHKEYAERVARAARHELSQEAAKRIQDLSS